jgi:hypothetical protein
MSDDSLSVHQTDTSLLANHYASKKLDFLTHQIDPDRFFLAQGDCYDHVKSDMESIHQQSS